MYRTQKTFEKEIKKKILEKNWIESKLKKKTLSFQDNLKRLRRKQNNRERAEHIKYLPMLNRGYFNDMKNTQAFPHLNIFFIIQLAPDEMKFSICVCNLKCVTVRRLRMLLFHSLLYLLFFNFPFLLLVGIHFI